MQIFHIYDLPHSDTVPVKGTINDKSNIIIQCQISLLLLFFFFFFYSNYNAIALPSILKVTMTLPMRIIQAFRLSSLIQILSLSKETINDILTP